MEPHRRRDATLSTPRVVGAGLALLLALLLLFWRATTHQPLSEWLIFRYLGYWLLAGSWSLSCLALGHVLVGQVLRTATPVLEHLAVSLGVGVFGFQLLFFVLGLLQLYGAGTFFGLPLVLLLLCGPSLARHLRRTSRLLQHTRARGASSLSPLAIAAIAFGVVCLVALYLPTLAPINSSYDSRWRHMMLAEQYAVHGGIRRFPEGWLFSASPQLTPLLYAWAFLLPLGQLFDRVELCAHVEVVVFLWTTLLGIPAMVRALSPRANPALVWTARFLFPGVFLYDSNLSIGADHIGAVFAPALLVLSLRAFRAMNPRTGLLLGAMIAAAACAKETTALLLVPGPVLTVVLRFLLDLVHGLRTRAIRRAALLGSLAAGLATLALSTPHWLKNLVFYGDPLYPNLHRHFAGRPWSPDSVVAYEQGFRSLLWSATPDKQGLLDALATTVTFSFVPHAWWSMHRDVPVFGSLFTLLLLVLPFLPRQRRLWAVVAWVHVAILAWFWIHHEDRHLQVLVPWMAAFVAAIGTQLWRSQSSVLRGGVVLLFGAQLAWGADAYFYPSHLMLQNAAPIRAALSLLEKGTRGQYDDRLVFQKAQRAVGDATPKGAVVLMHERRDNLGVGRTVVTDFYGEQYGVDYFHLGSPARVFARLRELGVTHLAWIDKASRGLTPLGGDIVFFEYAQRATKVKQRVGSYWLAAMPASAPKDVANRNVAVLGCGSDYRTGMYRLSDLGVSRFAKGRVQFPAPREQLGSESEWSRRVFAIAVERECSIHLGGRTKQSFDWVATRNDERGRSHDIWLRR